MKIDKLITFVVTSPFEIAYFPWLYVKWTLVKIYKLPWLYRLKLIFKEKRQAQRKITFSDFTIWSCEMQAETNLLLWSFQSENELKEKKQAKRKEKKSKLKEKKGKN